MFAYLDPFRFVSVCLTSDLDDKRDNFDIVNFPFLDGDVPHRTSYGIYISPLICFARASSNISDFNVVGTNL